MKFPAKPCCAIPYPMATISHTTTIAFTAMAARKRLLPRPGIVSSMEC